MAKLVAFDFDGTLLNTVGDIRNAINHSLEVYGIPTIQDDGKMMSFVGSGLRNALKRSIADSGREVSEEQLGAMHALMVKYYNQHPAVETVPYEGIVELLEAMNAKGIPFGVFSNKRHELVGEIAEKVLPTIRFQFLVGHKENYPLKPDVTALCEELEKLSIDPLEVLYVGDSEVDYKTAMNGAMEPIIVDYGFRSREDLEANGIPKTLSSVQELQNEIFKRF